MATWPEPFRSKRAVFVVTAWQ